MKKIYPVHYGLVGSGQWWETFKPYAIIVLAGFLEVKGEIAHCLFGTTAEVLSRGEPFHVKLSKIHF